MTSSNDRPSEEQIREVQLAVRSDMSQGGMTVMGIPKEKAPGKVPKTDRKLIKWSPEDKVKFVRQYLKGDRADDICKKNHISEGTFYSWRNLFMEAGEAALTKAKEIEVVVDAPIKVSRDETAELKAELETTKQELQEALDEMDILKFTLAETVVEKRAYTRKR